MKTGERSTEFRAGLVLYGGSSLAVYMGGVSLEFLQVVKANTEVNNPYARLLNDLRTIFTVDVIAGTSAGGLNGAFLARALTTGGDLKQVGELWRKVGDFGALADWNGETPTSLLNGDYFLDHVHGALTKVEPPSGSPTPLVNALDLFLTTTDLYGRYWRRSDFLGSRILGRQHTKYFHLKYRPVKSGDEDQDLVGYDGQAVNDFCGDDAGGTDAHKVDRLAKLARTTAAFPAVFAPVQWPVAETYQDEPGETADVRSNVWLSDGGILDNSPFGPVLKTIYHRPARRKVDRKLFYVEPDPEDMDAPNDPQRDLQPNALRVAWAVLELRMYQGIDHHLRSIEEHNQTVEHINQMVDIITQRLPEEESRPQAHRETPAGHAYMALRTTQVAAQVRKALIEARCKSHGITPRKAAKQVNKWLPTLYDAAKKQTRKTKKSRKYWEQFVDMADTLFLKRQIHFVIEQLGRAQKNGQADLNDLLETEKRLWELLQELRQVEFHFWNPKERQAGVNRLWDLSKEKRAEWLLQQIQRLAADCRRKVADSVKSALDQLGKWNLWEQFASYDLLLYPLSLGSTLGERDQIEWVRISPYDATTLLHPNPLHAVRQPDEREIRDYGRAKMAGDAFFHFGGFLSPRWRANDFMWGRLDAADQLIRSLVAACPESARPKDLAQTAHDARIDAYRRILADELDADGRAKLALRVQRRRLVEAQTLSRSLQAETDPGRVAQTLERLARRLKVDGRISEAKEVQQAGERLSEAAAAQQGAPEAMSALPAPARMAFADVAASTMAPDAALLAPDADAWQIILRYAEWEDMRGYLLQEHDVGREGAASLNPAVLANTAVDMADNARQLVETVIGNAPWKLPAWVASAGKWLSVAVVRFRQVVRFLQPRPAAGQDDRRPAPVIGGRGLLTAALVIAVSQNALYNLLKIVPWANPALRWTAAILLAVAMLRLLFPRQVAAASRLLPGAGPAAFGLAFLAGYAAHSPWLKAQAARLVPEGVNLDQWRTATQVTLPWIMLGLLGYNLLLGLTRWSTRAFMGPRRQPIDPEKRHEVKRTPFGAPEGIMFDQNGHLVVSTTGGYVWRYRNGKEEPVGDRLPRAALGLVPDPLGGYLLAGSGRVWRWTEKSSQWKALARIPTANGLAALDNGDIVVSGEWTCQVWRLHRTPENPDKVTGKKRLGWFLTPNGLAVNPRRQNTLYVAGMFSGKVFAVPLSDEGHPVQVVARLGAFSLLDGIAVLADGDLAVSGNWGDVFRIAPGQRSVRQWVRFPRSMAPANLAVRGQEIWFAAIGTMLSPLWWTGHARGRHVGSFKFPQRLP